MSDKVRLKTTTKKATTAKYNGGYKNDWSRQELTCACCHNKFIHYGVEILYKFKGKVFCKWSCKCKYKRQLEQKEREKLINEWKRKTD